MTVYIPYLRELPSDQMAHLDATAKFSVQQTARKPSAYEYEWPDLRVVVQVTPDAERQDHLEQFVRWLGDRSRARGQQMSEDLSDRIRSTTIILGFVVEKAIDREIWHDRVQDMIGMICCNTKSIVFWEGMIFDENCTQVWPRAA